MGRIFASLYDLMLRRAEHACLRAWRRDLLLDVGGEVLEIGAGTGLDLPHYRRDAITRLVLAEPDAAMRRRLARCVERENWSRAELADARAESLPFPDASFDVVVSTLVLCSVADPALVLSEVRRVLRATGRFLLIEHVAAAPGSRLRKWQARLDPIWRRCAGGCRLARETTRSIEQAGFSIAALASTELAGVPPFVRPAIRGSAMRS
ncbi:MAG: methyltransferase domain-containing protein [Planctomycetes bacterium]|nr:methyltransferase domain-containing protein [Planctomycetota bacterium]